MNTPVAFAALVWISVVGLAALRRRRRRGALVGAVGREHRTESRRSGHGRRVMTRTSSLGARRARRRRAGSASAQAPRSSPSRSTGSRSATTPPTGWRSTRATTRPRASTSTLRELQGLGRLDRQGRHRPRRCRPGRRRRGDRRGRPRRHDQDRSAWCSTRRRSTSSAARDSPITKPKDLEGKTLGAPPGDGQRQMFPAFAKLNGIDAEQGHLGQHRAGRQDRRRSPRSAWTPSADYTTGLPFYEKAMRQGQRR